MTVSVVRCVVPNSPTFNKTRMQYLSHSSDGYWIKVWGPHFWFPTRPLHFPRFRGAVEVVIVLQLDLQQKVCQWLEVGRWFSPGTPVSSTNRTNRHDIAEILMKVALSIISLTQNRFIYAVHIWNAVAHWQGCHLARWQVDPLRN